MTKLNLSEIELAERWGVSPKTLQRWRNESRGPSYLKLSKRVAYPIEDIRAYEHRQKKIRQNSHDFAVQQGASLPAPDRASDPSHVPEVPPSVGNVLIDCDEAIYTTQLPSYFFTSAKMRKRLEIPHYHVGRTVRFKLAELRQWEMSRAREAFGISADADPSSGQHEESTSIIKPATTKMELHEALRRLNNGTLSG
jgi:predicted DNA-binding transcriptional regulator AlpA